MRVKPRLVVLIRDRPRIGRDHTPPPPAESQEPLSHANELGTRLAFVGPDEQTRNDLARDPSVRGDCRREPINACGVDVPPGRDPEGLGAARYWAVRDVTSGRPHLGARPVVDRSGVSLA